MSLYLKVRIKCSQKTENNFNESLVDLSIRVTNTNELTDKHQYININLYTWAQTLTFIYWHKQFSHTCLSEATKRNLLSHSDLSLNNPDKLCWIWWPGLIMFVTEKHDVFFSFQYYSGLEIIFLIEHVFKITVFLGCSQSYIVCFHIFVRTGQHTW